MKNVIVVTSSPRKNGNSEILAQKFAEGAKSAGNQANIIAVRNMDLKFCTGCLYCNSHDKCVLNDGIMTINNCLNKEYWRKSNLNTLLPSAVRSTP